MTFLKVGSDYIAIEHIQSIEAFEDEEGECEVTFTSGDAIAFKLSADTLMRQIEERLQVGRDH